MVAWDGGLTDDERRHTGVVPQRDVAQGHDDDDRDPEHVHGRNVQLKQQDEREGAGGRGHHAEPSVGEHPEDVVGEDLADHPAADTRDRTERRCGHVVRVGDERSVGAREVLDNRGAATASDPSWIRHCLFLRLSWSSVRSRS